MTVRRQTVVVTTDGAGAATAFSPYISGYIQEINYVKTDYAAGVDFTITAEATGETLWTQVNVDATATVAPRQPTHSNAGVAALYAAGGTAVNDRIALGRDRVKIVIAAGGATKIGTFHILTID